MNDRVKSDCKDLPQFKVLLQHKLIRVLVVTVCSVVTCDEAQDIVNAERVGDGNEYLNQHTYTCRPDNGANLQQGQVLRHTDGSVNKTITCQQSGSWTEQDLSCAGEWISWTEQDLSCAGEWINWTEQDLSCAGEWINWTEQDLSCTGEWINWTEQDLSC